MSEPNLNIGERVLLKNRRLLIVNKPAGLPVQDDLSGDTSLQHLAERYCQHGLYLVNRVDRPVSGIVLFAKDVAAMQALSGQFQARQVRKVYLAATAQRPDADSGTLRHDLKKVKGSKSVVVGEGQGQEAVLHYRILGSSDRYHLWEIELETGRFHQIRAQLAAIGCPVKGDVKYGDRRSNADRSIHLHAYRLELAHPISGEALSACAPLPDGDPVWDALSALLPQNPTDA